MADKKKIKTDRDFDDQFATYYRGFSVKDGELYCKDHIHKTALKWDGEDWVVCAYVPYDERYRDVKTDEVRRIAKFPPWDKFDEIQASREAQEAVRWENLIATTTKRVIGYTNTAFGSDAFLGVSAGKLTDEEYAAIIKDYREHGYFYTGEDYQDSSRDCTPVLENYRYVDFSRRGFGALVAEAHGDFGEMAYCAFTEADFFEPEDLTFPKGGLYEDVPRGNSLIEVDEATAQRFVEASQADADALVAVLVPADETGYYWEWDGVTVQSGDAYYTGIVRAVCVFADEAEYDYFRECRELECSPWQDAYRGRVVLLVKPD